MEAAGVERSTLPPLSARTAKRSELAAGLSPHESSDAVPPRPRTETLTTDVPARIAIPRSGNTGQGPIAYRRSGRRVP